MTTRPTTSPLFATDATLGTGAESALTPRLDPGSGVRARGLLASNRIPARWMNWILGVLGDWASYLTEKTDWLYAPKNYGAVADGVADDRAAVLAAATACAAAGGGEIPLTGTYRFASKLVLPANVSLVAKGRAVLIIDHATDPIIELTGTTTGGAQRISGIRFEAAQVNDGAAIYVGLAASVELVIENCKWNESDDKLRGWPLLSASSNSGFDVKDSEVNVKEMEDGFEGGGAYFRFTRVLFKNVGLSFNDTLITCSTGKFVVRDCLLDMGGSGAGCTGVWFSSSVFASIHGNRFGGGVATTAVEFDDNATFDIDDNLFTGGIIPYDSPGQARADSHLGPTPALAISSGAATITIPAYASNVYVRSTRTTPPTIAFESPLSPSQQIDIVVVNFSASNWTTPLGLTGATTQSGDAKLDDIVIGGWLSGRLAAVTQDAGDDPIWHQIGDWARYLVS